MKKIFLTLAALALMANALAQAPFRIDTSYQTYQHFDYDAWVSEDSLMKGKLPDILNVYGGNSRGSCDVLQYNFTDKSKGMNVVGLSAIVHVTTLYGPLYPAEYLLLYDDDDSIGDFQPKAQVQFEITDTPASTEYRYSYLYTLCGQQCWPHDIIDTQLWVFEYYFDSAITVHDSFYVGCTDRSFLPRLEGNEWSNYYAYQGERYFFATFESMRNMGGCQRPHILWKYFDWRYPTSGWRHYDSEKLLLVMPIIEVYDTVITGPSGCPKTEGAFVRGNYSDTVTVQWDSDSLHPAHLVSWGPAGTWPNDGNIDTVWGDNKWVFTDTAYQDDYMVAYVSTLCTDWDSVRHSVWSSALSWRLHNWNMGGHDDDVGIPDDRSDLARFTHIMPNPASHAAMVASSFRIEKVEAYNAAGTKVLDQAVGALNATLDLDGWPQGAYVLLVRTAAGTTAKRLVVQ